MPSRRALLGLAVAAGALPLLGRRAIAQATAPREVELTAQRFRFTPGDITLRRGEPVVLLIRSLDFVHGFHVPDLDLRADLVPGRITRVALTPPTVGVLEYACDNFCGDHHEEMHGRFTVVA